MSQKLSLNKLTSIPEHTPIVSTSKIEMIHKKLGVFHNIILSNIKKEGGAPHMIRHINGNVRDNRTNNLKYVKFGEVVKNIDYWMVNWVLYVPVKYHKKFVELCREFNTETITMSLKQTITKGGDDYINNLSKFSDKRIYWEEQLKTEKGKLYFNMIMRKENITARETLELFLGDLAKNHQNSELNLTKAQKKELKMIMKC